MALGEYRGPKRADTLIRYAVSRFALIQDELGYRFYLSELLRLQAQGKTFGKSYLEMRDSEPQEERGVDEIIADVVESSGIILE